MSTEMKFADLLGGAQHTAFHLEMRDSYSVGDETDDFEAFKRTGKAAASAPSAPYWDGWVEMVQETVRRGVVMRRARIVSEPVTDYIRYEHAITGVNVEAGEQVRWLPRPLASHIALPGNDFWVFDEKIVQFNLFTGDGDWASPPKQWSEDPAVAALCSAAFAKVWERAVPHARYAL